MDALPAHTRGLLVLGGLGALAACGTGPADDLSGAPTPSPPTGHAAIEVEAHKLDADLATATPPPERLAVVTATEFATAWARPDLPQAQWWAGVSPWCATQIASILRTTDPASIAAHTVTGPPNLVGREAGQLSYTVPTDAGPLRLTLIVENGSWKVWTKKLIGSDADAHEPQVPPRTKP